MNKNKTKRWFHLSLFVFAAFSCTYVTRSAWKEGDVAAAILTVSGMVAAAFGALRTAFFPVVDKVIDELPDDSSGENGHVDTIAILVVLCVSLLLMIAAYAHADTPISKCWTKVCAEPQVSISVVEYNLATRKVGAGILPVGSVGYGVRDVNDYVAAGLFVSTSLGGGQPNYVAPAILFRFMRALTLGAQVRVGEDATQWSLLAGGGLGL